ncbi:ferritin-like domain-containing protein [Streptomonospora sp. S1-112]|uniref:Ferritin-like domain-containing protein n=1 Tax=Streptomonospora mangrovi TaxID=2883123 RepID=A0A9X3SBX8_9ACTN|nr:ferritin-like fold-containing protein [Streptomonospora mangrovi]MDA0562993.1 ferritin-like domain-containing protein [Streptomonospora mangrovi]
MSEQQTSAAAGPAPAAGAGVIDLLGLLAYARLVAFFRLAGDAELAPTLAGKGELAEIAVSEQANYRRLHDRLRELGADPEEAMRPFVVPLDAWHARTEPQSWLESLVKAYVGDGIADDFYRRLAELADPETQALVRDTLVESGRAEFVAAQVRAAIADDPRLAGRLSLWARRLVGEALSQAQSVAARRPDLAALLGGGAREAAPGGAEADAAEPGDLAMVSRMFADLTDAHAARLEAMGLSG